MRANVVAGVLVVLIAVLIGGVILRSREPHERPLVEVSATASAAPTDAASASAAPVASATASASASASATVAPDVPKLDRPLRVVGLGWDLLAAGIVANDGAQGGAASQLKKRGLELRLTGAADANGVEGALARGGTDERGADVAIMPLPRFVASYERLRALEPVIFLVVGWSEGREVVLGKGKALDALAGSELKLRAESGSTAGFVGLFALDVAGAAPDHVKLVTKPTDAWDFAAFARRQDKADSEQPTGTLLFGTAEAARLVPIVAVAQASLLAKSEPALSVFAESWLEGERAVAADAAGAARKVASAEGAPEPLAVLASLGVGPASLGENATALGLSGRGAATLEKLFSRTWDLWRGAGVLGIPPERAPVDGRVVAGLVRAGGALTPPPASGTPRQDKPSAGKPLLVYRVAKGKLDEDALFETVGFLAGVFPRSTIKVTVHSRGEADKKLTASLVARAEERFGLAKGRLAAGSERAREGGAATVEVMPVP